MEVKLDMVVKDWEREMCGLGLMIEDVVGIFVVGIKIARAKNNNSIIDVAFEEIML